MSHRSLQLAALAAIDEEAEKLLRSNLPPPAAERVQLIVTIARYGLDVRTEEERERT
jgi:hypothetical protein